MNDDIWTQAAESGDEQVKRELLAGAEKIRAFALAAGIGGVESDDKEEKLIERLTTALRILYTDGEHFPDWVMNWYRKAYAWWGARHLDSGGSDE